jgi:ribonuclease P protein component
VLTFAVPERIGHVNRGGRWTDSAALFISLRIKTKDYSHEAHFSAEQSRACPSPRFSSPHVDRCWPQHPERPSRAWPQEAFGLTPETADRDMRGYGIIKKRSDFLAANRGKRYATPGFVLLVKDRNDNDPAVRLGITITKKVGNAVVRNRMRRRFRELAREMLAAKGKVGADHILIGRDGGIERDFGELRADLAKALDKLCNQNRSAEPVGAESDAKHQPRKANKRPSTGLEQR